MIRLNKFKAFIYWFKRKIGKLTIDIKLDNIDITKIDIGYIKQLTITDDIGNKYRINAMLVYYECNSSNWVSYWMVKDIIGMKPIEECSFKEFYNIYCYQQKK